MRAIKTIIRALKLDEGLYGEIEKDERYIKDSIIITALAILLSSIGFKAFNVYDIIVAIISVSIGLALWYGVIIVVSYKLLSSRINLKVFVRCILTGISPMIFNIFYLAPLAGFYIAGIVFIWTVVSIAIALKELLEQEFASCLVLSALGAVIYFITVILLLG